MPHIIVKCYPGKTEEQKKQLAQKIAADVEEVFGAPARAISVSVVDVPKEDWKSEVWDVEIQTTKEKGELFVEPGYQM